MFLSQKKKKKKKKRMQPAVLPWLLDLTQLTQSRLVRLPSRLYTGLRLSLQVWIGRGWLVRWAPSTYVWSREEGMLYRVRTGDPLLTSQVQRRESSSESESYGGLVVCEWPQRSFRTLFHDLIFFLTTPTFSHPIFNLEFVTPIFQLLISSLTLIILYIYLLFDLKFFAPIFWLNNFFRQLFASGFQRIIFNDCSPTQIYSRSFSNLKFFSLLFHLHFSTQNFRAFFPT